jgi:hypothetical protein
MVLLNNGVANLVTGYDRIREADLKLPGEWRHRLLVAYARRREAHDVARDQHRQQIADLNRKAMIGLAVAAVLLLGGLFLSETFDCLGPPLVVDGSSGRGTAGDPLGVEGDHLVAETTETSPPWVPEDYAFPALSVALV